MIPNLDVNIEIEVASFRAPRKKVDFCTVYLNTLHFESNLGNSLLTIIYPIINYGKDSFVDEACVEMVDEIAINTRTQQL
jgi:hypothetical protein